MIGVTDDIFEGDATTDADVVTVLIDGTPLAAEDFEVDLVTNVVTILDTVALAGATEVVVVVTDAQGNQSFESFVGPQGIGTTPDANDGTVALLIDVVDIAPSTVVVAVDGVVLSETDYILDRARNLVTFSDTTVLATATTFTITVTPETGPAEVETFTAVDIVAAGYEAQLAVDVVAAHTDSVSVKLDGVELDESLFTVDTTTNEVTFDDSVDLGQVAVITVRVRHSGNKSSVQILVGPKAGFEAQATTVLGNGGPGDRTSGFDLDPTAAYSEQVAIGGIDTITTQDANDLVIGGAAGDTLTAANGDNIVIGDSARVLFNDGLVINAITLAPGVGGIDTITTGDDDDIFIGGTGGDTINAGDGRDIGLGDNGQIIFDLVDGENVLRLIESIATDIGGNDTISLGQGDDVLIAGVGTDYIDYTNAPIPVLIPTSDTGADVIVGDNGRAVFDTTTGAAVLDFIETTASVDGAADYINAGEGPDVVLGGSGGDVIHAGVGDFSDVVLGDNGEVDFDTSTVPGTALVERITSTATGLGGDDEIIVGDGEDFVVAGVGDDRVNYILDPTTGEPVQVGGDDAADYVIGDNGNAEFDTTTGESVIYFIETIAPEDGGDDFIFVDEGPDVVLGGSGSDVIHAGVGDFTDVVLGDNGEVDFDTSTVPGTALVERITSTATGLGGDDEIIVGDGEDFVVAGVGDDRVNYILDPTTGEPVQVGGDDAADYVIGDNGNAEFDTTTGESVIYFIETITPEDGGDDFIFVDEGPDVVLGGSGSDVIHAGVGDFTDVVLGDNGEVDFDTTTVPGTPIIQSIVSTATDVDSDNGKDEIIVGEGDDVVIAGVDDDRVNYVIDPATGEPVQVGVDSGDDVVIGDSGEVQFGTTTGAPLVTEIKTTDPQNGPGDDLIFVDNGNDIVLAGSGNDVVDAENETNPDEGVDIVFGDNGTVTFDLVDTGAGLAPVLATVVSTATGIGGDDVILVGDGDDLVVAGSGNDLVNYVFDPVTGLPVQYGTDGGNDIVIGDNGQARFETSTGVALLEMIMTTAPEDGGDDFIFTGDNTDIVFGGSGNDVIDAQTTGNSDGAQDIVVGDNGVAVFDTSGGISRLVAISTSAPESGGQDRIVTGTGDDIVFGGVSEDIIDTSGGDFSDVVVGDNGRAIYVDGVLRSITTSNPGEGQDDYIVTGTGADVVLGGTGDDHIDAGRNAADVERDVVIGDNGLVVFSAFKELLIIRTIDPYSGGKDFILTGGGSDVIFGGSSSDFIMAGSEGDLVLGDNGFASFSDVNGNPGPVHLVYSTAPIAGGHDEIHAGSGDDLVFGGSFNDTIFGGAGNDILLGDHGLFDRSLPRDQQFRSIMTTEYDGGGDDLIYGDFGSGIGTLGYTDFDDVIMGQQGNDELYGGLGDDDITGGHNVVGGVDGDDFIDGEEGADVVLGDNGTIKRILIGVDLDRYLRYPKPFGDVVRSIVRFDDIDKISGNDRIHGGLGRDILHGQRGADRIFGDDGDDNIFGDLGSDFLSGGAGHDVVLAEPGQIVPVFNTDGTPLINADGSWRRDVILEEQGVVVDYINGGIGTGISFSAGVADRLLRADLILIAGIAPMVPTPWDTLLILINFIEASTNEIDGGIGNDLLFGGSAADLIFGNDGNDHIFGGLGNDVLNGGDDNDLVVGDEATNAVLRGYLSRILRGVRLVADLTTAPLGIELGLDGTFVVPQALIRPEMLECAADGAPLAEILTGAAANLGDPLTRKDGSVLAVTIGLHGSLAHNSDRASGNDVIDGGDGDDVLIGDHLVIAQAVPVLDEIVAATARLQAEINRLVAGYARLATEHDVARNTAQGIRRYHPARLVTSGNDVMRGGHGEDLFTGDHAMLTNVDTTVVTDEETFIGDTLISQQLLEDLIHLSSDVANMVVHARQTVLAVIDPGLVPTLHETTVGNDSIDATVKARVFGDLDPDIISGGNTTYLDTGVTAALTPDMLAAAIEALNTTPASSQHPLIPTTLSVADQDTATVVASTCNPATSADRFVTDDNNNTILAAPATATAPQPLSALVDNEDNSDN